MKRVAILEVRENLSKLFSVGSTHIAIHDGADLTAVFGPNDKATIEEAKRFLECYKALEGIPTAQLPMIGAMIKSRLTGA